MMQAAEIPWITRPINKNVAVPTGDRAINSDPRTPKTMPTLVSLTRPNLSARPPAITMTMPENKAVILTAMLLTLSAIRKSSRIVGATFKVVCANNQKVTTARTIPRTSLLSPWY
jgi:hypothetical protein